LNLAATASARISNVISAVLALSLALLPADRPFDFHAYGPYDGSVPKPEAILGYGPGERHTVFRDQERVVYAIAERARARVRVIEFGKSTEGRPLKIAVVSSSANIQKLERLRQDYVRLANPKPGENLEPLVKDLPALVWINQCIHGDETASFESGMWLLYNLAASKSPQIEKLLDDAVVVINPSYNPDGHERYVVWYNSVATGSREGFSFEHGAPSVNRGRTNHYRFDMNRDRISISQAESRQEVREFLRWNPHVYVDQHGEVRGYFFPPVTQSVNVNVDRARYEKWTEVFGRATAQAFDRHGWLYFIRETFDFYMPGYLDSWASLSGAIGMTHETDGGEVLAGKRDDGTILTLRDGMAKHLTSALAVIGAAAARREELLRSYAKFKSDAVTGKHAGSFQRVVAVSEDPRALGRLKAQLDLHGIRSYVAKSAWTQGDAHDYWEDPAAKNSKTFPAGSLVVDMAQSQGPVAKALLEPKSDFEPEFVKEQLRRRDLQRKQSRAPEAGDYVFYDLTGWCQIYAHNLQAWWCESAPPVQQADNPVFAAPGPPAERAPRNSTVGYWLPYTDADDALAVFSLLEKDVRVQVAAKAIGAGDLTIPRGSFLIFASRNEEGLEQKLREVEGRFGLRFRPLETAYPSTGQDSPGSYAVQPLKKPKIAVVFGDGDWTSDFGATWYVLEKVFRIPFTPVRASALPSNLHEFTCVLFPPGRNSLNQKLKEWVQAGGCAVALGSPGWMLGENGFLKLKEVEPEDDGEQISSVPGSQFLGTLDGTSWISFGYGAAEAIPFPVFVEGSGFYRSEQPSVGQLRLPEKDVRALSGWVWPEESKHLAGTIWLAAEPVGRGHAVAFFENPLYRAIWPGNYKLVLNAMLFGAR
jgi:hypothetical protein